MKRIAVMQPSTQSALPAVDAPPHPDFTTLSAPPRDLDVSRAWKVFLRRRNTFVAIFLGIVAVVAAYTLLQPKSYTTEVKMIAGNSNPSAASAGNTDTALPVLNALLSASGVQSSETYAELLHESPVARDVVDRLHLNVDPGVLAGHVRIKPVTNTAIIGLTVSWSSPETSAKIANTFANVFVDRQRNLVAHQADSAVSFLQTQLPLAEQRMKNAERALAQFQARNGIADLNSQMNAQLAQAASLEAKTSQAEIDAKQAQAQLASVTGQLATMSPTIEGSRNVGANPVAAQLGQQIATVSAQLDAARKQYTDQHPTVIALEQQLASLKREAAGQSATVIAGTSRVPNPVYQALAQQAATLRAQISSAQSQATTARAQRAALEPAVRSLPERTQRIGGLQREAKAAQEIYATLEKKYEDAMISKTTALSDVTITQPADAGVAKVSPNVALNIGAAIVAGLVLAFGAIFTLEFFDDRFRSEDDVKERLGLPVLAQIPALGPEYKPGLRAGTWLDAMAYESYFELVTALRYSSATAPRSIAITSPKQGDGKSTVALNIAVAMAQLHARVLIVDADLRRPTLHSKLGISNGRGLSDVLVGVTTLENAVTPSGHDGVWSLTSGTRSPNPVALLQSDAFDRMLAEARERFDFVILDAPALGPIIDGVLLGLKADGTVLVVSAAQTDSRAAQRAIDKLAAVGGLNVIGVVLNQTKPEKNSNSDYYLGAGQSIALQEGAAS